MRRQVVASPAENAAAYVRNALPEFGHFAQQRIDLLLLANDDLIELLQQVFVEAGLDFKFGQAVVSAVGGVVGLHGLIGHPLRARNFLIAVTKKACTK